MIDGIYSYKWEKWLERPFQAFIQSFFEDATRLESFEKLGFDGVTLRGQIFQNHVWYISHELLGEMDKQIEVWLKDHTIYDVTDKLSKFKFESENKINLLLKSKQPNDEKFAEIYEILKSCCTFIWLAHGLESYYQKVLNIEVPIYVKGDTSKFIGDASFPSKKNDHALMEEMIRGGASDVAVSAKFGWLKIRDGFADPFTSDEIARMRSEMAASVKHESVTIPKELKSLFAEVSELVYFRTARTDVFYQLLYLARPIITKKAESLGLSFNELRYYRSKSLIQNKLEKYSPEFAFAYFDGTVIFQEKPIIQEEVTKMVKEFKGSVAYKGVVKGTVKIVKEVSELGKVEVGDILVTQMTFPSFIPAMIRAIAFVTDEGGITCHAAIVAREMKKPCIIGTKVATKVLKDGDTVEVDANTGIVTVIK